MILLQELANAAVQLKKKKQFIGSFSLEFQLNSGNHNREKQ